MGGISMNINTRVVRLGLALLAMALFFMAPAISAAQSSKDSQEVSGLLAEAKTEATQLKQDTEEMSSFVRTKTSWETHADQISQIKQHVNKLGELVTKMDNAKGAASPWQQQSINRVTPLLKDLAASVTTTIKHLNDNKDRLLNPPYPDYAAANAEYASDLAQLVSDYVAYGEAKHKSEDLAKKLEVPGH
jgi:methyl-accepting chemotaxis protein